MTLVALATEWVIAGTAFLVAVGLMFAWLKTGKKPLLIGVVAVLVAGGGTLAAAALIVTDEERIESEIYDLALDVQRNDVVAAIDHIHPDVDGIILEAKSRLPDYEFDGVLVRFRRVEISQSATPRTAAAHFIVTLSGVHKSTNSPIPQAAKIYLEVEMVEEGDRWLIRDYEIHEFIEAFQQPKK